MKSKIITAIVAGTMLSLSSCQDHAGKESGQSRNGTNSAQGGIDGKGRTSTDPGYPAGADPSVKVDKDSIKYPNL